MLSRDTLQSALAPFFDPPGMPGHDAIDAWVGAYSRYASTAVAGGTALTSLSIPVGRRGPFFGTLDVALRDMWMSAVWVGPSLTGKTALVPSLSGSLRTNAGHLISSRDRGLALQLTVDALHTYTLSITVAVTSASGVVTVPLV